MKRPLITSTLIASAALIAAPALASDMAKHSDTRTTQTVQTIDAEGHITQAQITIDSPRETAVLGALDVQSTDAYVVEDESGALFLNHVLRASDLPDPRLSPEVIETVTVEHRGMTFTNRVVRNETFNAAQTATAATSQ